MTYCSRYVRFPNVGKMVIRSGLARPAVKILGGAVREDRKAANSPRRSFALAYLSEFDGREKKPMRVSILDDYQGVALDMADWSALRDRGIEVAVERFPFADEADVVRSLADSEIVCAMRERTVFSKQIIDKLPKLKLLITTGMRNASFDMEALKARGVTVCGTGGPGGGNEDTAELAWGLILGAARRIAEDHTFMRQGGWQTRIGHRVAGKTIGCLGLGRLGSAVARVGLAFGMKAIAWSQNLTAEKAAEQGVERVEKDELFRRSDVLSVHLVLSPRSRGLVGVREIGLMKKSAILVNTSRGPICDTGAVIAALKEGRLAYAGFDVYDKEPLAIDHPLRSCPNVILTPHIGYVTDENYRSSFPQYVEAIMGFLDGKPVRVIGA
jgi:phosphoglycerate dehydrogenase-like enzyme